MFLQLTNRGLQPNLILKYYYYQFKILKYKYNW